MNDNFDEFFLEDVLQSYETLMQFVESQSVLTVEQYNRKWPDLLNIFLRACRVAEFNELVQVIDQIKKMPFDRVGVVYKDLKQKLFLPVRQILDAYKNNNDSAVITDYIVQINRGLALDYTPLADGVKLEESDSSLRISMTGMFIEEALEIVGNLANDLIEFENNPENLEIVNRMFRFAHTLKGNAATLGFDQIKTLAHRIESFFDLFRKKELRPDIPTVDLLSEGATVLEVMVKRTAEGLETTDIFDNYLRKLDAYNSETAAKVAETVDTQKLMITSLKENIERENQSLRIDSQKLDNIVNLVGEVNIFNNNFHREYRDVLAAARDAKLLPDKNIDDMLSNLDIYNHLVGSLQGEIIKARMIPLIGIFKKYPSLIRTLARQTGKEVSFEYTGEHIEIDKSIYEEIADPIMHLIRNCVDHGIETPEQRVLLKKSRKGHIRLEARIDGSQIRIVVEDDGAGINKSRVLEKAIAKGLVSKEKASSLSESEICDFIFYPGFSTREAASDISGRGVGMDVVSLNIHNLKGMIMLKSTEGEGTQVSITLPTSLTIREVLIVGKDIHALGIPIEFILEVMDVYPVNIIVVENKEFLEYNNELVPFIYMRNVFGIKTIGKEKTYKTIVLKLINQYVAICVDSIERRQQVMMKPLNELIKKIKYINAVSLLGDGSILLLLDIVQIAAKLDKISVPVLKDRNKYEERGLSLLDVDASHQLDLCGKIEYILFSIDAESDGKIKRNYFGVEVKQVGYIMESLVLATVPDQNKNLAGFCLHVGETIPVYNLPGVLGGVSLSTNKIVLINYNNSKYGILCHRVHKLIRVQKEDLSPIPILAKESAIDFIAGIIFHSDLEEIVIVDPGMLYKKMNVSILGIPDSL